MSKVRYAEAAHMHARKLHHRGCGLVACVRSSSTAVSLTGQGGGGAERTCEIATTTKESAGLSATLVGAMSGPFHRVNVFLAVRARPLAHYLPECPRLEYSITDISPSVLLRRIPIVAPTATHAPTDRPRRSPRHAVSHRTHTAPEATNKKGPQPLATLAPYYPQMQDTL